MFRLTEGHKTHLVGLSAFINDHLMTTIKFSWFTFFTRTWNTLEYLKHADMQTIQDYHTNGFWKRDGLALHHAHFVYPDP